jgi:hypothetical protein
MKARRSALKDLSDVVGDANDLAEFTMLLADEELFDPAVRESLERVCLGRRAEYHREGRALGERVFTEKPDRLVDRVGTYWRAAHEYDPER